MAGLTIEVKCKDVEEVKNIIIGAINIVKQIEINDYADSLGHDIKMNKSYIELKEALSKSKVNEYSNVSNTVATT